VYKIVYTYRENPDGMHYHEKKHNRPYKYHNIQKNKNIQTKRKLMVAMMCGCENMDIYCKWNIATYHYKHFTQQINIHSPQITKEGINWIGERNTSGGLKLRKRH
jgi:hypothetical protein